MSETLRIPAGDATLAATLYRAEGDTIAVVTSAMGMPRHFYSPFAEFLQANGISTLTWDYRGIGDSADDLRHSKAHIHDWGEQDLPAVIDWMREHFPGRRLVIVAHSVGGQVLGMSDATNRAERIVMIGSQSGYWRLWSGWQQVRIGFIWYFVVPVVARLFGYFPARWFGLGVDLPNSVARQWARWGRDPDYLMGRHRRPSADNYATIDRPVLNVWISDDDIASYAANRRMIGWYRNANVEHRNVHPSDFDVKRIGHFRLFRESPGRHFWPELLAWINKR